MYIILVLYEIKKNSRFLAYTDKSYSFIITAMCQCKEYTDNTGVNIAYQFSAKNKTISNVSVQLILSSQARVVSKTRGTWNSPV